MEDPGPLAIHKCRIHWLQVRRRRRTKNHAPRHTKRQVSSSSFFLKFFCEFLNNIENRTRSDQNGKLISQNSLTHSQNH